MHGAQTGLGLPYSIAGIGMKITLRNFLLCYCNCVERKVFVSAGSRSHRFVTTLFAFVMQWLSDGNASPLADALNYFQRFYASRLAVRQSFFQNFHASRPEIALLGQRELSPEIARPAGNRRRASTLTDMSITSRLRIP
jgi:hypothetical protein